MSGNALSRVAAKCQRVSHDNLPSKQLQAFTIQVLSRIDDEAFVEDIVDCINHADVFALGQLIRMKNNE